MLKVSLWALSHNWFPAVSCNSIYSAASVYSCGPVGTMLGLGCAERTWDLAVRRPVSGGWDGDGGAIR